MRNSQRVIQLAYERAIFKFSALSRQTVKEAIASLEKPATPVDPAESRLRQAAQQFLLQNGDRFLIQLGTFFRDNLQRAMRTMYTDLRKNIGSVSADNLTLIDDETITRNMDIDRLVQRMRDANPLRQGRINVIIAQLHNSHEVRERENPFRPYPLARSLYEVLWAMEPEAGVAKLVFQTLSTTMVQQLPEYYDSICEVFESSGVQARLLARPATLSRMQRLELAQRATEKRLAAARFGGGGGAGGGGTGSASASSGDNNGGAAAQAVSPVNPINQDVMASLQRMLEAMPARRTAVAGETTMEAATAAGAASTSPAEQQATAFQDFVSDIFHRTRQQRIASTSSAAQQAYPDLIDTTGVSPVDSDHVDNIHDSPALAPASPMLVAKLSEYQEIAARGESINGDIAPEQNQLFALRENLGGEKTTHLERVTIDIVASLFAFILEDDQITPIVRVHIGRLQIPFLKAAMLAPDLLSQDDHPARLLLNRMGSLAIGIDPATEAGSDLRDEVARIVSRVLSEFYEDFAVFTSCREQLDSFVATQLRHADAETAASIEKIEAQEEADFLTANTTTAVTNALASLSTDQRIVDIILNTWTKVLIKAVRNEAGPDAAAINDSGDAATVSHSLSRQEACALLPDLLWSVQHKTAGERSALLRILPGLISRMKTGFQMIGIPEEQGKKALDTLFDVHSKILRSTANDLATDTAGTPMSLEQLQSHFAPLSGQLDGNPAGTGSASHEPDATSTAGPNDILPDVGDPTVFLPEENDDWLAQMKVGNSIERWNDTHYAPGRLVWTSMRRTLFMFKMDRDSAPIVYSADSLIKALREGSVRLVEYASVFERAVESLLIGTESFQTANE